MCDVVSPFKYNIEFISFLAAAGTDFSWAYNRRSYSARVTAVLLNAEYSGRSVNSENFTTKMRLNGHARCGGDGTRWRRESERGPRREGGRERRRRTRDFGERDPPAHKRRCVGRRAPAASSSTDRGIPSRDARINRFPVRPYKRPKEGGTGGRRKRRARRRGRRRGARARRDHSTRTVGTKERRRKEKRERENQKRAGKIGSTKIGSRVY